MCSETQFQTKIEYTTTSFSEDTQCSVCHSIFDKSLNRIIIEACGHRKCRECLIKEAAGCSLCARYHRNDCSSNDLVEDIEKQKHTITSEPDLPGVVDNENASNVIEFNGGYKCTICFRCFKTRNNRKYHQFCDKNRTKPFQCDQCDRQFVTAAHLKYHKSAHKGTQNYPCPHCGKSYTTDAILRKHLHKHQNDRRYKCVECNEGFVYKHELDIHRNKHQNIYYKCPECEKQFLVKSNYTKHVQIHSGKNRRICTICQNSFSGSSALKTHMLTHSKLRQFRCSQCQKSFIDQRTLNRHSKIHIERYYECTVCSARSGREDNIRRHVRNLHASTDNETHAILKRIFDNYALKYESQSRINLNENYTKKTDNNESDINSTGTVESTQANEINKLNQATVIEEASPTVNELNEFRQPKNIMTSVIKFAGRAPSLNTTINTAQNHDSAIERITDSRFNDASSDTNIQEPIADTQPTNMSDIDVVPANYKPLNYEPYPEIAPLPLLNTNTNLSVYRQLLSPYLKKTSGSTASASPESSNTSNSKQTSVIIDRPPKKMIKKYARLS